MGQPEELLPLVRPYYLVILLSMVFVMLFNTLRQFTDGTTDTASGMWCLLAGNALNILGNWLLIGGVGPFPEWGLFGAGVATLVSRIFMFLLLTGIVLGRRSYAPYRRGFMQSRIKKAQLLHLNRQSFPISIQMGLESGSFTFSAIMAGWIGAIELAAFQVLVTIGTLGFLFYYSFGAGMSIRIASFVGLKYWWQVKLAAKAGSHLLILIALISSVGIYLFALPLVEFFTPDAAVIALSLSLIVPLLLYQFGDAMQICYANALRGTAHVMSMMKIAFISYVIIGIPTGYLLGFPLGWGIHGIFLAFSAGLFSAAIQFYLEFRRVINAEEKR
jgi:MATE family multidrug resistance protein